MQKRVGIARTIVTRPKVILYDAPTEGLDPQNAHRISDLIADLRDRLDVTSVVVSHDLRTVFTICNRVSYLEEGRLTEPVPPSALVGSGDPLVRDFVIGHPPEEPLDPLESTPPEPWKKR
jgi:phospholipid/cholesterol/gamma-HCH transport system ATP-binding protein